MWETYKYVIDHHIVPVLGDNQLRAVTADDVDEFLVDRVRSGYSSSVVRRTRNTLSQVFRWGVGRRQCSWDPASFAELPPASVYDAATPRVNRTPRALNRDEARRFGIGHVAPLDLRHTAASHLSEAGVPKHELADLLGHTTTRMVEVHYRHRLKEAIDVAVEPMDDLLGDEPNPLAAGGQEHPASRQR